MITDLFAYNGIALQLVKTRMIARDNVWSPDGTDLLHTRHSFDVDCVYNPGATSYYSGGTDSPAALAGTLPAATDLAIRERLMEPRRELVVKVGGDVLLRSPAAGSTVDALNGPRPISCHVREIHGTKTFLVSYRIETYVSECESAAEAAEDPLLSNRYETTHSVDDQDQAVITTVGVACFRMDALALSPTKNADHWRARCLPPLPLGFQRKALQVRVNSVGDKLTYTVVDQQMFYSLGETSPFGVKKFEAVYTQSSAPVDNNGAQSIFDGATLDVRVWGNVHSLRVNLIVFALKLAIERLRIKAGPVVGADPLIRSISVGEVMHDRVVDFRVQVQLPVAKQGAVGLGAINGRFLGIQLATTLANDGKNPPLPRDGNSRGTYTGELFAAAIQQACTTVERFRYLPGQTEGSAAPPYSEYAPPAPAAVDVGPLVPPSQSSRYSNETAYGGAYTEYHVRARWENETGGMLCPVAGRPDDLPAVLGLHTQCKQVTFTWTAERNGTRPNLPHPNHHDSRCVLLRSAVDAHEVYLAPDGVTPVFRVSGEYKYAFKAPGDEDVEFLLPVVPWTDYPIGDATVRLGDYKHGIIDPPTYQPHEYPDQPTPTQPTDPVSPSDPQPTDPKIESPPGSHGNTDPDALL